MPYPRPQPHIPAPNAPGSHQFFNTRKNYPLMFPSNQRLLFKAGTRKNNQCFHPIHAPASMQDSKEPTIIKIFHPISAPPFTTSLTLACVEESFIASASLSLTMRVGPNTIPRLVGCSGGVVSWLCVHYLPLTCTHGSIRIYRNTTVTMGTLLKQNDLKYGTAENKAIFPLE
jgi:hypothetical protein